MQPYVSQGFLHPELNAPTDACFALDDGELGSTSCSSGNVLFNTSTTPREGWQPLFVVKQASNGQRVFTDDPYQLMRRPYQREYEVEDILGWISPATADTLASHPDPDVADLFVL